MIINKMDELCPKNKSSNTRRIKKLLQTQAESMLGQMKVCTTPKAKRELIKSHNPNHYIFGIRLDPRNPYEENEDEHRTISD
jgi:ribosomal protein L32